MAPGAATAADYWAYQYKNIDVTAKKELDPLEIYSIAELKKNALHPKDLDLDPPSAEWVRPVRAPVGKYRLPD